MRLFHSLHPARRIVTGITLASLLATPIVSNLHSVSASVIQPTGFSALTSIVEPGRMRLSGNFAILGGKTFFSGKTFLTGDELWVTDGTPSGTLMLKDINPGSSASNPNYFHTVGNKVLFVANDGVNGTELWATDGTEAGTVLLKDIELGAGSSIPGARADISSGQGFRGDGMSVIDGKLYFSAHTSAAGREPWMSDGTANGTVMLSDVLTGATGSMDFAAGPFLAAGNKIVFPANSGTTGTEPMVYDGTSVSLLADVDPGGQGGWTGRAISFNGNVYFEGHNGNKYSTWKTDGTANGTAHAINIAPNDMAVLNNRLLIFGTQVLLETPMQGQYDDPARLWISDGTQGGTTLLGRINPTNYPDIALLKQVGSHFVFIANDGTNGGELWTTDGTVGGTQLLVDAVPGSNGAFSGATAYADSFMYTNAQSTFGVVGMNTVAGFGNEAFRGFVTDGTPAGTSVIPGNPFTRLRPPMPAGNHLVMFAQWGMSMTNGLVTTAPGSNSQLSQLGFTGRRVPNTSPPTQPNFGTPSFNASTLAYSINLTGGNNTVDVSPGVTTDPGGPSCTIEGVACSAGQNGTHSFTITAPRFIEIVTTAGNGTSTTYRISVSLNGVTPTPATTTTTTTTPASGTPSSGTPSSGVASSNDDVVPGVTVTDPTVYTKAAPRRVASGSAISVLTPEQVKTQRIQTTTPAVCVPTNDDIVFIDEGRCNASVLSKKTGEVLRRIRTTVIEEDVVNLGVGNEIVTLAPIYFQNGSSILSKRARDRVASLKEQVSAAGTVMVIGHTGMMMGDTPENRALSRTRAVNTVREMRRIRATGPFYSIGVGAIDPAVPSTDRSKQARNRRVVIVLIP